MSVLPEWEPLDVASSELSYAVTSRVLEEFAQGHSIGDVLRELVQNEYDAQGRSLSVTFGPEGLEVRGTGRVIDRAGWRRLSVMLGTGRVVGDDRDVPQKLNGIGSKNHGLRALFLMGDRIYVRSGGRQTLLDLYEGTPAEPRPDPSSAGMAGAQVFVPYRQHGEGLLEAYDASRRARDMDMLAAELAPTLVKLADPSSPRSLRAVTVRSTEQARLLSWKQSVKLIRRHRLGGDVLARAIDVRDEAAGRAARTTKIAELEYRKSYPLPAAYRTRVFPDYFRVAGGRVRIGLSLRVKRKKPDLKHEGSFYYPLGIAHSATGCAISVSAPFELNADRSALVDPDTNSWNEWLLATAAEFALDLLASEWFDSFGAAAYLALEGVRPAATTHLAHSIAAGLSERECWPTRARANGSRKSDFARASTIRIGASPELDDVLSDNWRLDRRLDDPRIREMARRAGAFDFTVASAIRLRCAGQDATHLATSFDDEGALYYTGFPGALANLERQERFARAFEAQKKPLSKDNLSDLRASPTTLTAGATLAAPSDPLWVVEDALAAVAPVVPQQRLHPRLAQFRTLSKLCKPFDISDWALDVSRRAADGSVEAEDRETLYRYLLRQPEAIRRNAWTAIRSSPVVRDHRGEWVSATDLIQRRAAGASRLEAALHFPSKEIGRNARLARTLRIRPKVVGNDLVRYANLVAANPELADEFEETLQQLRRFLTRPTVARLRTTPFLRTTDGAIAAPEDIYVRTPHLHHCLGEDATFAAGQLASLHTKLGCQTTPLAEDITAYLDSLRSSGNGGPPNPETLYPALAEALRNEHGNASWHADEPILYDGREWHAPEDVLLGKKHRLIFAAAMPVIAAGGIEVTYEALGANREPTDEQWGRFFAWIDERAEEGIRRLTISELTSLQQAYLKVGSLPTSVPDRAHVFVDSARRLHTRSEVHALTYLINDDPRTAAAVAEAGVPIAFAELSDPSTRRFYRSSGVTLLTEARRAIRVEVGAQRPSPPWFREPVEITRLQQPLFASAVHAVATATGSRTAATERQLRRRLRNITRLVFVSTLEDVYEIGRHQVRVVGEVAVDGSRIALRIVRSKSELHGVLARAIAGMAESAPTLQQPLADAVFRLLTCESSAEFKRYLEGRGIEWRETVDDMDDGLDAQGEPDGLSLLAETLKEGLLQNERDGAQPPTKPTTNPNGSKPVEPEPRRPPLPPLADVELQEIPSSNSVLGKKGGSGGGGGGSWRPRTPAEQEEDRALGRRGEELVYQAEVARVVALGYPASRVVWTSETSPAADHDIFSVAEDGVDLWLEVKATMGRHGRFDWPRAEFELALRVRERYVLCRVYEAHTAAPSVRREADPIGKLALGQLRLDIANLAAEVAPVMAGTEKGETVTGPATT